MHVMRYFRDTRSPNCNSTLRKASYQNLSSLFAPQAGDEFYFAREGFKSRMSDEKILLKYLHRNYVFTSFPESPV